MKPISMQAKHGNDWCHLCGERHTMIFAEFTVSKNAEHSNSDADRGYFRICQMCVHQMKMTIEGMQNEIAV